MYYPNNITKEEFDKFLEETGYDKEHKNLVGGQHEIQKETSSD